MGLKSGVVHRGKSARNISALLFKTMMTHISVVWGRSFALLPLHLSLIPDSSLKDSKTKQQMLNLSKTAQHELRQCLRKRSFVYMYVLQEVLSNPPLFAPCLLLHLFISPSSAYVSS